MGEPRNAGQLGSVARARWAAAWIGLLAVKLWLVDGQRLTAYGTLTIDDRWYVTRAAFLSKGNWLGPFDGYTLIKQPGYPMFIAAMHALRMPLLLSHHLLYAAAALVVVLAFGSALGRSQRLTLFGLLLFSPMTMNSSISARVDRAGIYPALTLMLFACLVAVVTHAHQPSGRLAVWLAGAGLSLGAMWVVREEWILIVPAVAVALAWTAFRIARSPRSAAARIVWITAAAAVPLPMMLGTAWLRHVNQQHYGLAVTNVEQTSMSAALGAMFRVHPVTNFAGYPVTAETRALMYTLSPSYAALRGEIETGGSHRFVTTRLDGVSDLSGAVYQWVVLDALHTDGLDTTATELDSSFRGIANELNAACDRAQVTCGGRQSGLAPAWQWDQLPVLTKRSIVGLWRTIDLHSFHSRSAKGNGTEADRELFTSMTSEPLAPAGNDGLRSSIIDGLRWLYLLLTVLATTVVARRLVEHRRTRQWPSHAVVTTIPLGALLAGVRIVGLAYLDLTAFQAFSPSYLASAYAVLLATVSVTALAGRDVQLYGNERSGTGEAAPERTSSVG
jgi:hypothetical protein